MPFIYENEKTLLERDGIKLVKADLRQYDFNGATVNFGVRYLVTDGERMITTVTLDRAEHIMTDVLAGNRMLTPAKEED